MNTFKKILAALAMSATAAVSAQAQGYVAFNNTSSTKISTNKVENGAVTGVTFGGSTFYYALYYSTTSTSVNGQTAAIAGRTNLNYAFTDSSWTLVAYGTNLSGGIFSSMNADISGRTPVPGVTGGTSANFVVIGWSAGVGRTASAVQTWLNGGAPATDGWIGQSKVSGSIAPGATTATALFATNVAGLMPGFVLGRVPSGGSGNVAPSISVQPANQTVTNGQSAWFSVTYAGTPTPAFQWFCNSTNIPGQTSDTLTVSNVSLSDSGNSYFVTLTNVVGSVTSSNAVLTVTSGPANVPPTITSQPANATVAIGSNVTFTVGVTGTAPLTYQWSFNGTNLANGTNASLNLTGVQSNNVGNYSVSITNAYGSTNSAVATLIIQALAPFITAQPGNHFAQPGKNVTFTVGVSGSSPLSYQWTFNGANLPAGTNASLVLNGVQLNQAGSYAVTISNPYGTTNSASATLSVTASSDVGYVIFTAGVASAAKIYTNSVVDGQASGLIAPGVRYNFALFASTSATDVNGNTNAILGAASTGYAFNDSAWTPVAYGTNNFISGRFISASADSSGLTPVLGFVGGTTANFVVIGWSANIGQDIASVQTWFNGGSPLSDGWIGQSMVGDSIWLGDNVLVPASSIFGVIHGFTLGLAAGVVNGHAAYAMPYIPPLLLSATLNGQNLQLTWPLSAGSYGVQSASSPAGPWSDTGATVTNDGTTASATIPATGSQQFFRLMIQ